MPAVQRTYHKRHIRDNRLEAHLSDQSRLARGELAQGASLKIHLCLTSWKFFLYTPLETPLFTNLKIFIFITL